MRQQLFTRFRVSLLGLVVAEAVGKYDGTGKPTGGITTSPGRCNAVQLGRLDQRLEEQHADEKQQRSQQHEADEAYFALSVDRSEFGEDNRDLDDVELGAVSG